MALSRLHEAAGELKPAKKSDGRERHSKSRINVSESRVQLLISPPGGSSPLVLS